KVMITRDVVFYEEVNYLQWKGVEKEIAAAGTAIAPDKVDDLLEEKESEGVGDEGDEELEDVERADSVDWVWEKAPTREADESKVVEIAGEQPSKEVAEDGIDEVAEEEGDEESAAEGDSDPWKLLNSDDNNAKMREIEELLEEGAIVIGREVKNGEGKALADSSEDEVESPAEELGKGKRVKKPNPRALKAGRGLQVWWHGLTGNKGRSKGGGSSRGKEPAAVGTYHGGAVCKELRFFANPACKGKALDEVLKPQYAGLRKFFNVPRWVMVARGSWEHVGQRHVDGRSWMGAGG
ncbi:unnamed protein product, partial [Closterium sp. Naga37s-1]